MNMENICHEVFISYSSMDEKIAQAVCHRLEEDGVTCWMAPRDVIPGLKFEGQIVRAIKECAVMVLVFSPHSNESDHVGNEVAQAFNASKIIIPFLVEETDINDNLDYYLRSKHWLVAYPDYREKTDELSETVRRLLQKEQSHQSDPKPAVDRPKSAAMKKAGAEVHVETDVDCSVYRFGTVILEAVKGTDNVVYLQKGKHRLTFISKDDPNRSRRIDYEVDDLESCDVIEVFLDDYYSKGKEAYDRGNYTEAVKWYRKSADLGDAAAQNGLGYCYEYGKGVGQDYAEAVKWYRKSANQGNADAQYNLGNCYYHGKSVSRDYAAAAKWYRKSAAQGHTRAKLSLSALQEKEKGV